MPGPAEGAHDTVKIGISVAFWLALVATRLGQGRGAPPAEAAPYAEVLFLAGPLVIVPLGLPRAAHGRLVRWARAAGELGAFCLAVSWFAGGVPAEWRVALTVPWVVCAALAGALALRGLRDRSEHGELDVAARFALLCLAPGALWLVAYQAGVPVLGVGGVTPLVVAAHLHLAGFGALVLTAALGRALGLPAGGGSPLARLHRLAVAAAMLATPLLAAPTSPALSRLGAALHALMLVVVAALCLVVAQRPDARPSSRWRPYACAGAAVLSTASLLLLALLGGVGPWPPEAFVVAHALAGTAFLGCGLAAFPPRWQWL